MIASIHNRITEMIDSRREGDILFPTDFLETGSSEAIHMSLSRLVKQKKIVRLGKGIYMKPKFDPVIGPIQPSLEEIAAAVADKEQVIIRPTGSYALNKLGISTQVPTRVVFLTNGSRRTIRIGRGIITFKSTTPRKLAAKNELVFLATQALEMLGEKNITPQVLEQLQQKLQHQSPRVIREDAKFASNYVARTLFTLADKIEQHD